MKIDSINREKLGSLLIGTCLSANLANHTKVGNVTKEYTDNKDLEQDFLIDIFNSSTDELIDKWFDGKEAAIQLVLKS